MVGSGGVRDGFSGVRPPPTPADWQRGRTIDIDPALYRNWAGAEFFKPGFQRFCGFSGLQFVCQP